MADYRNVDVGSLRGALQNALSNLNSQSSEAAMDAVASWQAQAKNTFLTALNKQVNTNYSELKSKLEDYLLICDYIAEWKALNDDIKNCEALRDDAKGKIKTKKTKYQKDSQGNYLYDKWGNHKVTYYTEYSSYWDNTYQNYVNKINSNREAMTECENKIRGLI